MLTSSTSVENFDWKANIKRSLAPMPRRTVVMGVSGVGKSTWASKWPNPIAISTEGGLSDVDVPVIAEAKTLPQAWAPVSDFLKVEDHGYQTLIVDTADWLEQLIWQQLCDSSGHASIGEFGFGRGYVLATAKLRNYLDELEQCRVNQNMHIVLVAHVQIVRFEDPLLGSYDRYVPRLHKEAVAAVTEWADEVLFGCYRTFTRSEEDNRGKSKQYGIGDGERIMYCSERPGHTAKNRLGLPDEMPWNPRDFEPYRAFIENNVKAKEEYLKQQEAAAMKRKPAKK